MPAFSTTWATKSLAMMNVSPPDAESSIFTYAYSNSGCMAMATFAKSVHGVVVQITKLVLPSPSFILNLTYIEEDFLSSYSTSASASAVSQAAHQLTGFRSLYIYPFSTSFANDLTISASYFFESVRYGLSQSPEIPSLLNSSFCIATYFIA